MPKKMPARVLAEILRSDFREGGAAAADACCAMIERLHGHRKFEAVLNELARIMHDG